MEETSEKLFPSTQLVGEKLWRRSGQYHWPNIRAASDVYLPSLMLVTLVSLRFSSEIGSVEGTGKPFHKKAQVDTETQQPVAVQIKERSTMAKPVVICRPNDNTVKLLKATCLPARHAKVV